jgi:hypothetical protein
MRVGLIAVALAAAILPAPLAIAAAPPRTIAGQDSFGIQLLSTAAETRDNPLARTYIVAGLAPGARISRLVEISNATRSTADIAVYPTAASFDRSIFAFASGRVQDELSRWTSVSRRLLQLPSGGHTFVTVTVNVPRLASAGERYAVVWAQMSAASQNRSEVTLVNRVGIRMYISIGQGGLPTANFAVGPPRGQRSTNGRPLVLATVHNTGQRTLAISGDLTLANGPGELRAGPFPFKLGAALAPGDSEPLTVTLNKILPPGHWRAELRLSSGLLQRTAEATIRFPARATHG